MNRSASGACNTIMHSELQIFKCLVLAGDLRFSVERFRPQYGRFAFWPRQWQSDCPGGWAAIAGGLCWTHISVHLSAGIINVYDAVVGFVGVDHCQRA